MKFVSSGKDLVGVEQVEQLNINPKFERTLLGSSRLSS
jgi:hypothetical protein